MGIVPWTTSCDDVIFNDPEAAMRSPCTLTTVLMPPLMLSEDEVFTTMLPITTTLEFNTTDTEVWDNMSDELISLKWTVRRRNKRDSFVLWFDRVEVGKGSRLRVGVSKKGASSSYEFRMSSPRLEGYQRNSGKFEAQSMCRRYK